MKARFQSLWESVIPAKVRSYRVSRRIQATVILGMCYFSLRLLYPQVLPVPTDYINYLKYSPDGQWVAINGLPSVIWDVKAHRVAQSLPCHWSGQAVWSPDSTLLTCPNERDAVDILRAGSWGIVQTLSDAECRSLAWSFDGRYLGGVAHDSIYMWDATTGQLIWNKVYPRLTKDAGIRKFGEQEQYEGNQADLMVDDDPRWEQGWFLADGRFITQGKRVDAWNEQGQSEPFHIPARTRILQVDRDGRLLVLVSGATENQMSDMTTNEDVLQEVTPYSRAQKIYIWNPTTETVLATMIGHADEINAAAFSPNNTMLVTVAGLSYSALSDVKDHVVRVWDVHDGSLLREFHAHWYIVDAVDWSPDGRTILSASGHIAVHQWNQ